ncbi:MAG: YncE family protein, partial [Terracidiphilus sp.]
MLPTRGFLPSYLVLALAAGSSIVAQTDVTAILPDGREIHPAGNWIPVAPFPFALAVRSDGAQLAVPSIGFPFALNVVADPAGAHPGVTRMPAGHENDPAIEVHAGLVYSPDGALLYVATGDSGKIRAYRTSDWQQAGEVPLDGACPDFEATRSSGFEPQKTKDFQGSFAAALAISADGRTLYALDQGNWRIVILDAPKLQPIASIPTGNYPYALALSPDGSKLYVVNTGLFEYTTIPGADAKDPLGTGLHFPPFGYPSKAAREGAIAEGRKIPGLGDENSLNGSSLWTYDVRNHQHPAIAAKLRLGERIVETPGATVGGAAPSGVAAESDAVYVSLAHEDSIAKISPDGTRILAQAELSPFAGLRYQDAQGRPLRGVMPSGLAVRGGRVYVAESGIDAVGVLDAATLHVIEHIPVGWNPSAVAFSPDGKTLYVVNTKGRGAGPNGGSRHDPNAPTYVGSLEYGSISAIPLAGLPRADELTQTVVAGNTAVAAKQSPLPHLKHCFLVIRENRTYDEVLGDVAGADGDPSLARYGLDGWAQESESATHLKVTPSLHALVARYAMSDNFFVDGDVSADGHRWVVGMNPTPYFNTAWTSGYGGRRHDDPGAAQP